MMTSNVGNTTKTGTGHNNAATEASLLCKCNMTTWLWTGLDFEAFQENPETEE